MQNLGALAVQTAFRAAFSADGSLLSAESTSAAVMSERHASLSGNSRATRVATVSIQRLLPYFPPVNSAVKLQFVPFVQ